MHAGVQYLRFHLGAKAAQTVLDDADMKAMLTEQGMANLSRFVQQVAVLGLGAAPEREYAVLGQLYLEHVVYCQAGPIELMLKPPFEGNLRHYLGVYRIFIKPKVDAFEGFHDFEDDDHDAESDEEEHPVPWDDYDACDDTIDNYDR